MSNHENWRIPRYVDMETSKIDEFLLKQNEKTKEIKEKLRKASLAHEREHLKIASLAEEKGEAAMEESTEKYKFKLYTFKKKSRTKTADAKAVKRRAEFALHRTESWLTPARITLFKSMIINAIMEEEHGSKY